MVLINSHALVTVIGDKNFAENEYRERTRERQDTILGMYNITKNQKVWLFG